MTSGGHNRKVTQRQRHQLVQIYLHMGQEVVAPMCEKLGLHPNYARGYASATGVLAPRKYTGGGDIATTVDHDDPRWARARAVGVVIV
jgi:hypothetical protein